LDLAQEGINMKIDPGGCDCGLRMNINCFARGHLLRPRQKEEEPAITIKRRSLPRYSLDLLDFEGWNSNECT
jgi:hypothetical protein